MTVYSIPNPDYKYNRYTCEFTTGNEFNEALAQYEDGMKELTELNENLHINLTKLTLIRRQELILKTKCLEALVMELVGSPNSTRFIIDYSINERNYQGPPSRT